MIKVMPDKEIINELKRLMDRRGNITKAQREYARVEEKTIVQMHPITRPCEEKRFSHLRTLKSYVGESAFRMISEGRRDIEAIQRPLHYANE